MILYYALSLLLPLPSHYYRPMDCMFLCERCRLAPHTRLLPKGCGGNANLYVPACACTNTHRE